MKQESRELQLLRRRQKRDLFKRFRLQPIVSVAKKKLYSLFGDRCFKCGSNGNLQFDHHIPLAEGGVLAPGNIVVLCRRCNSRKGDHSPQSFYTAQQLSKLIEIFAKQYAIFEFEFDFFRWESNRENYLIECGVDPELAREVCTNREHRNYCGPQDLIEFRVLESVIGPDSMASLEDLLREAALTQSTKKQRT